MTREAPDYCPFCGTPGKVRLHCKSRNCNWLVCAGCKHYGTEDGSKHAPVAPGGAA